MAITSSATFGALLRHHRLRAGLTQEELAERAGVSARGVQRLERDRTAPRAETVRLLAAALGLGAEAHAALIAAANPDLASPPPTPAVRSRLPGPPLPPTALVGREGEVAAGCALLRHADRAAGTRLLTLTGPGGVGKTRLAMAIATEVAADFGDGVGWVELAALRNAELVPGVVAQALGVQESGEQPLRDHLRTALADRHLLLVLDNCEHLLPAMTLIAELLAACPRLVVLATSRTRLRLRGERELPVEPLSVPTVTGEQPPLAGLAGVAAVRLFVERAQAVQPDFSLSEDNAAVVTEICRRLEGLPLALELAAARVKLLPPAALLTRLERRLPLLAGGARDAPERQRTMRDAIAWSHELLIAEERVLFRRLAVFAGGCSLEAVEAVSQVGPGAAVVESMTSLLDHSLLHRSAGPGGEPRYRMLETIREYGLEQLQASGEDVAVRDTHAAYYLALAETAEVELQGAGQVAWLNRLESEHDNLRAALRWLPQRGAVDAALRLAGAIWFFRWIRGHYSEGREQFETLLALPGAAGRSPARAKALNGVGVTAVSQGDTERAIAAHEEALAISREIGDERSIAFSLVCLATALMQKSDYDRGEAVTAQSLALSRALGDGWGEQIALANLAFAALHRDEFAQAEALFLESLAVGRARGERWSAALTLDSLGWMAVERGDNDRARALFEESLAMIRELGDRRDEPDALAGLGRALQQQGDLGGAITLYEESLAIARQTGDRRGIAQALFWLGHARWLQGDGDKAQTLLQQALALFDAKGDQLYVAASIEAVAVVAGSRGAAEHAARLFGAAAGIVEGVGAAIPGFDRFDDGGAAMRVRQALGEAAFAIAWEAGRTLALEQAISEALAPTI